MKTLEDYAGARVRAIVRALEKYHQFQETDSLHRIRVEIKKLKSTLLIVEHAERKFDFQKAYAPLRNIFRKAGQIRQSSVMVERMLAHGMQDLPVETAGDNQKAKDRFRANTPVYMTQVNKLARRLKPYWKNVRRKQISVYVKDLQRRIRHTLVPNLKARQLHATRKKIKQTVYLSRLTGRVTKAELGFYAMMESAIGNLHDNEMLLELLTSFPKRTLTAQVTALKKHIRAERKAIGRMADRFYGR